MAIINIRDYEDEWGWCLYVIGMGENHSSIIVPKIEAAILAGDTDITVNINTVGGSVFCCLAIKTALQRAKEAGLKIITVNEGICASAGTPIFMEGDERISYTSLFMIHNPSIFVFDNMTEQDMERELNALKIVKDTLMLTYAPTGLDEQTLRDMLNAETWLTPALCKSLGFATEDRSSPDKKADVLETSLATLEKASPENRIYANKFFNSIKSKNNNMDNVKETLKKNNDLLTQVADFFKNIVKPKNEGGEGDEEVTNASTQLEDESYIYYDGALEVGAKVFTDEAMTVAADDGDHTLMDGRTITVLDGAVTAIADVVENVDNSALEAENKALKDELATLKEDVKNLTTAINASNKALEQIKNIKSTFKPENREQDFSKAKPKDEVKPDLSTEAREEAKAKYKNKK